MYTQEQILADPEIATFLSTHQGAAERVRRAAGKLRKETDAICAIRKILPALSEKVLHVFFSYKKKDEAAAKAVVNVLRKYAAGKLEITYMADFPEDITGSNWRKKIRDEITRANWFILLLPDPSDDWDWCLYETGQFDRQPTSADRLICLHHPNIEVPGPIQDYLAVPATINAVKKFLRMVFISEHPIPGMGYINKDIRPHVNEIAKEIVDAISPPKLMASCRVFEPSVVLKIDNAADLQCKDDLDTAKIISANNEALHVFDRFNTATTWGELRAGIIEESGDGRWREELFHVIRKIANGRKFSPIQAVFHSTDGKVYRPVAHAINQFEANGAIESYHITFSEEVGAFDTSAMPEGMNTLVTSLRFAFRFRWEFLERFGKRKLSEEDVDRICHVLERIEQDAASRGLLDKETIKSLFPKEQADLIEEMYADWEKLRDPVNANGELDVGIREKDTLKISAALDKLIPMNQQFLEMATDRFAQMNAEAS